MSSSKREEVNLKMHEREPMSQRNQNPYLVQNNYLEDLETQQSFLIPKNSNFVCWVHSLDFAESYTFFNNE